ncbi:MAG: TonB-dependent receptor plug domain-containing protein, partial [Rhodocyclaceae bacterium]|nr:TonB-dependent receptor plug domain-containing protein [Rhodocyclaceae bacterium]
MNTRHHALYAAVLLACASGARAQEAVVELAPVTSTASAVEEDTNIGETRRDAGALTGLRAAQSDASALLRDVPGMQTSGAGAISALPVLHGMADDRLRVAVDDVDVLPACPNHMNPPLSYIAPARVARVRVFAGTAPVSEGGDNIGGVVRVESAEPRFARAGEPRATGEVAGFWRGNGRQTGSTLAASLAGERLALRYDGAYGRGDNLHAARVFKPVEMREDGSLIRGDEIASTAFERSNHDLGLAVRHGAHQLRLDGAWQDLGFEGFPNQRMDMTGNRDARYTVRYQGETEHATLHARAWRQRTRHVMDFGRDRQSYGTGMPMRAQADNLGAALQADWYASARDTVRAGLEWHQYTLWDWWPPVGEAGVMQPDVFWNIYDGRRERR